MEAQLTRDSRGPCAHITVLILEQFARVAVWASSHSNLCVS